MRAAQSKFKTNCDGETPALRPGKVSWVVSSETSWRLITARNAWPTTGRMGISGAIVGERGSEVAHPWGRSNDWPRLGVGAEAVLARVAIRDQKTEED